MPECDSSNRNDPNALLPRLLAAAAPEDRDRLTALYHVAEQAHMSQWRKVAEGAPPVPYIVHPLRVGLIVAGEWQCADFPTIAACLLHDTLEDCSRNRLPRFEREIERLAGDETLEAVWTLTKPATAPVEVKAARNARYFAELRKAPKWVRLVKCADRVDNLRDALAWGDTGFWKRYSSETIGWHLYLARETAPIAEVALFSVLVEGERRLRGRAPVWADGHLVDLVAAALIPQAVALAHRCVGLALRGETLIVGMRDPADRDALEALRQATRCEIHPVPLSADALRDTHAAGLFGTA